MDRRRRGQAQAQDDNDGPPIEAQEQDGPPIEAQEQDGPPIEPDNDHDGDAGGKDKDRDQAAEIASLLTTSRKNVRKETAKMRFPAPLRQGSTADKQQTWILDKLQIEAAVATSDYTRAHVILAFSDKLDKTGGRFKEFTSNELIDAWTQAGGTFDEYYLRSERLMGGVDQNARVAYITFISAALCAPIMEYLRIALPGVIREIPDSADPLRASKLLRLADEQLDPKSAKQLHVARAVHLLMTACNNSEQLSSNTARHVETIDFHQREVQRLAGPIFPDSLIKISVLGALSVTGTIWASRVPIYEQALSRDAAWAALKDRLLSDARDDTAQVKMHHKGEKPPRPAKDARDKRRDSRKDRWSRHEGIDSADDRWPRHHESRAALAHKSPLRVRFGQSAAAQATARHPRGADPRSKTPPRGRYEDNARPSRQEFDYNQRPQDRRQDFSRAMSPPRDDARRQNFGGAQLRRAFMARALESTAEPSSTSRVFVDSACEQSIVPRAFSALMDGVTSTDHIFCGIGKSTVRAIGHGRLRLPVQTSSGSYLGGLTRLNLPAYVGDVPLALAAVTDLNKQGWTAVFNGEDSHLHHALSGQWIPLKRDRNLFFFEVAKEYEPSEVYVTTRQTTVKANDFSFSPATAGSMPASEEKQMSSTYDNHDASDYDLPNLVDTDGSSASESSSESEDDQDPPEASLLPRTRLQSSAGPDLKKPRRSTRSFNFHGSDAQIREALHSSFNHTNMRTIKSALLLNNDAPRVAASLRSDKEDPPCQVCLEAKQRRADLPPPRARDDVTGPNQLWNLDVHTMPEDEDGNRLYTIFQDNFSHLLAVYLQKRDTSETAIHLAKTLLTQTNFGTAALSQSIRFACDNASSYRSHDFEEWCLHNRISVNFTCPDHPHSNGRAEAPGGFLESAARAYLLKAGASDRLFGAALILSCWVKNRLPHRSLPAGETPYSQFYGSRPSVRHLAPFGCYAAVWRDKQARPSKAAPTAVRAIYMGPGEAYGTRGALFWLIDEQREVFTERYKCDPLRYPWRDPATPAYSLYGDGLGIDQDARVPRLRQDELDESWSPDEDYQHESVTTTPRSTTPRTVLHGPRTTIKRRQRLHGPRTTTKRRQERSARPTVKRRQELPARSKIQRHQGLPARPPIVRQHVLAPTPEGVLNTKTRLQHMTLRAATPMHSSHATSPPLRRFL